MNVKFKNSFVFWFQVAFFSAIIVLIFFIEVIRLITIFIMNSNKGAFISSGYEVSFLIIYLILLIVNYIIASFSLYVFIFVLHVLDSNPVKTAPVCALALDFAVLNLFFFNFFIYNQFYSYFFCSFFSFFHFFQYNKPHNSNFRSSIDNCFLYFLYEFSVWYCGYK